MAISNKLRDICTHFARRSGGEIDSTRLQKLVYFADAWHLVWSGAPLVDAPFEAWVNGPVIKELRDTTRSVSGRQTDSGHWVVPSQRDPEDKLDLSDYERGVLESVWGFYGSMTTEELSASSHEAPWRRARPGLSDHERSSANIDKSATRNFYAMKQIREPGATPKPVRPPQAVRFNSASRDIFQRHEVLFAKLAQ